MSSAWQADSLPLSHLGIPTWVLTFDKFLNLISQKGTNIYLKDSFNSYVTGWFTGVKSMVLWTYRWKWSFFPPSLQVHYKRVRNLCPLSIIIFAGSLGCFYLQKKKVTGHCFAESKSQVQTHSLMTVRPMNLICSKLFCSICTRLIWSIFKINLSEFQHLIIKSYPTSLAICEMQIKTTIRYHFTPTEMTVIKRADNNKCWWGCRETGTLSDFWQECKMV